MTSLNMYAANKFSEVLEEIDKTKHEREFYKYSIWQYYLIYYLIYNKIDYI